MHLRAIDNFITPEQQRAVRLFISNNSVDGGTPDNSHVQSVASKINGTSMLCNMTKTSITEQVSRVHGGGLLDEVPAVFHEIKDKISDTLGITKDHVFLQILSMKPGGQIKAHYDSGIPGYITYKCNVAVIAPWAYAIHVDKKDAAVREKSLYAFEANLYRHWVSEYPQPRILLSYGFLLPNAELGYTENDPRIRLFNRIYQHYMAKA